MKIRIIILYLLMIPAGISAQERSIPNIPNIPGYKTLLCDFHLHTVFSDGLVWPTVRVDEAWREGLDAIAITDHLEYLPHRSDIKTDHNRAWQIAKEYAAGKNVIVIAGTEITKGMPPGHFNALFIKDANTVLNQDHVKSIQEAAGQGAFIMWNHPGWKAQQPDTMKWWPEHTYLYDQGWIHGIEVVNDGEFYPNAVDWAIDRNLTMIGSSDMHGPFLFTAFQSDNHRPLTFVFVSERSEGGIRDALFNGRTAIYNKKNIIGKETFLKALFIQSVQLNEFNKNEKVFSFTNKTDLQFDLILEDKLYADWQKTLTIKPGYESVFILPAESNIADINIRIKNLITGSESVLQLPLSSLEIVHK